MNTNPLVSVVCLTYNEELYVRDTFDNILAQETDFPFEILVYDDASQDRTPSIIREYANQYPDIFRITLYKKNNFEKGLGFYGLRIGFAEARGKYIAYCEGDDYWCDNHKLQKQVDFLESNPKFEVCAHETRIRNDLYKQQDGILFSQTEVNLFLDRSKRRIYTFEDALTGNIFHISSMMFRKFEFLWPDWVCDVKALDMVIFMMQAERGDIYVMPDLMSVYRARENSITSTKEDAFKNAVSFYETSADLLLKMDSYWHGKYSDKINRIVTRYHMRCAFVCLSKSYRHPLIASAFIKKALHSNISTAVKFLFVESISKLKKHL